MSDDLTPVPEELGKAAQVVERSIEFLLDQKVQPIAIASALLGGSIGVLANTIGEEAIIGMLSRALESIRNGGLAQMDQDHGHAHDHGHEHGPGCNHDH